MIDASSAAIGANVSAREVAQLPINGRQISQLYLMTPGAVNFGAGTFDDMRFNGRSYEQNAIRYDGDGRNCTEKVHVWYRHRVNGWV